MLNVRALTELFSQNSDGRLCQNWFLMTVNGTLLAYNQPIAISDLRREGAVAALLWHEHDHSQSADPFPRDIERELRDDAERSPLHTLVIESEKTNVFVRRLQDQLLLVLKGGLPPGRTRPVTRITAESVDGTNVISFQNNPTEEIGVAQEDDYENGHATSDAQHAAQNADLDDGMLKSVLHLQRKRLDALALTIIDEFDQSGFHMPDDVGAIIF